MSLGRRADIRLDDTKAAANLAKRGVPFEAAVEVFADAAMLVAPDLRHDYGEARFVAVGEVDGIVLSLVFADRETETRIISARLASRKERSRYGDR